MTVDIMNIESVDLEMISKYERPGSHIGVGELCEKIGQEILETCEGFDEVVKPNVIFRGQPFDRLCKKAGKWYIVEIKGARHSFGGTPSHTQKRRMRQVLDEVDELEPGLLQINLSAGKYKARYGDEVRNLIIEKERKRLQLCNIITWVKSTISST